MAYNRGILTMWAFPLILGMVSLALGQYSPQYGYGNGGMATHPRSTPSYPAYPQNPPPYAYNNGAQGYGVQRQIRPQPYGQVPYGQNNYNIAPQSGQYNVGPGGYQNGNRNFPVAAPQYRYQPGAIGANPSNYGRIPPPQPQNLNPMSPTYGNYGQRPQPYQIPVVNRNPMQFNNPNQGQIAQGPGGQPPRFLNYEPHTGPLNYVPSYYKGQEQRVPNNNPSQFPLVQQSESADMSQAMQMPQQSSPPEGTENKALEMPPQPQIPKQPGVPKVPSSGPGDAQGMNQEIQTAGSDPDKAHPVAEAQKQAQTRQAVEVLQQMQKAIQEEHAKKNPDGSGSGSDNAGGSGQSR